VKSRLLLVLPLIGLACSGPKTQSGATTPATTPAPRNDARVGLRAGWFNAGEAGWNMRLVSNTPPSPDFINRNEPGDFRMINSDLSFRGNYVIQGNFAGV